MQLKICTEGKTNPVRLMRSNWNKAALENRNNRKFLEEYDRHIRMTRG